MIPELFVASDLHVDLEFNDYLFFEHCTDIENKNRIFVLAGDVLTDTFDGIDTIIKFLVNSLDYFKAVVFTPGNHDLWGYNISGENSFDNLFVAELKKLPTEISNRIHYLHLFNTCFIDGIEFWGTTFWSRIDSPIEQLKIGGINDFYAIKSINNERLTITYTNIVNSNNRQELKKFLNFNVDVLPYTVTHRVVVTHFPLIREHTSEEYNIFDIYYNNHMEEFFLDNLPPALVISGHTHTRSDFYFNDTRFVCNPRGYPTQSHNYRNMIINLEK